MSDRDGYDVKKPWHVHMMRNGRMEVAETFDSAAEVIRFVGSAPDPSLLVVHHVPTQRDGNAESFLRYVNSRITDI